MEREKANHAVVTMCRVLGVSTDGYYQWRKRRPPMRAQQDATLSWLIARIRQVSPDTCGAPRMHAELLMTHGIRCARKRVARLMRRSGLVGVHRWRLRGCTHGVRIEVSLCLPLQPHPPSNTNSRCCRQSNVHTPEPLLTLWNPKRGTEKRTGHKPECPDLGKGQVNDSIGCR